MRRRLVVWVTLTVALPAAPTLLAAAPARASWSAPARVRGCALSLSGLPPLVVFPSSAPDVRSGPGMILWEGGAACGGAGGVGGAPLQALAAPLGPNGLPGAGRSLQTTGARLTAPTAAAGTTAGQVLVAGAGSVPAERAPGAAGSESPGAAGGGSPGAAGDGRSAAGQAFVAAAGEAPGAYVEGRAPGAFSPPRTLGGPASPVAAYSGYLGDAVLACAVRARGGGWALAIRVQRHYASAPTRSWLLPAGGRPSALAVTMDYRSDVLAVWDAGGRLYAREITQAGLLEPLDLLAAPGGVPELRALFSDDGRAIVAWRVQMFATNAIRVRARARARIAANREQSTTVALDVSGPDLAFGRPTLVERFRDLPGLAPPPDSLRLTRMSSEAVMMAWTGRPRGGGSYVVRASPVSLRRGAWASVTVSGAPRAREALLAELAPGPRAEVLALWVLAPRLPDGALAPTRRAIVAAWGHYGGRGEARFARPEMVAPPGRNGTPAAAFDPSSDRALAAWSTGLGTATPRIVYAQRAPGPPGAIAPNPPSAPTSGGDGATPVLAALVLVALALAGACLGIARRRARQASIDSSAIRIGTPLAAWRK